MALNNVPLAGQTLGVTRVPINQNFAVIDADFSVDHVSYNTINEGMHNRVSFPTQNPVPVPQAGIVQLYSQVSAITGQPELVFTHQAGSTAPLAAQIVEFTSAGWTNPGWTRLPSGILLKWHSGIGFGGGGSVTINVNTDVPGSPPFAALLTVQSTTLDSSHSYNNVISISVISFPNVTFSKFGGANPPGSVTVAYLAIGY
jgi:hypothetical protein